MNNYLQFDFIVASAEDAEKLIALLSEQDFEGFEETDENHLTAYIPIEQFNETAFKEIIDLFSTISFTQSEIENINWNQQWESGFQPVIVEDKVALRASFHEPIKGVEHEIVITPKMSFGTGHHATTYMMIQLMLSIDFKNRSVIDFGTGTGVLAILAEKLGATGVLAVDYDEWSIENTKENIQQNSCSRITIEQENTFPKRDVYDIVLANITLNVITDNIAAMAESTQKGANAFFSGFLLSDKEPITLLLKNHQFEVKSIVQKGDWLAILAEKQ
ncbi:50S ribosomal protein L11 methyltransferase [Ferruginibacter albus]|uniref:50S ribosomal protein L11 methyltransferase n=1 Tax=Ferruginibacter albus TaxID=2875540 RepID=UPI001CC7FD7A|nr:50S ribosomal protein L11 methyltransferase [Ferruginibacter albus]UAY53399.1 50S ribosomal protein L11 methyltransferase [Ferruginibacter albus]